ncbi:TPA: recombination protein NinG [Pseudomonas aeruginosa]
MLVAAKKPRKKTCKACREVFTPERSLQSVCSPKCGLALATAKRERERKSLAKMERREIRAAKERFKTRSDHMREAQAAFNEWVRLRDADKPCISCDSMACDTGLITGSRWDAGHYRSVGACQALRFEPLNVHRQCVRCNRDMSGNAVEYRIRLVQRIGADKVEWLEGPHEPRRFPIDELKEIKAKYRALSRELKRKMGRGVGHG